MLNFGSQQPTREPLYEQQFRRYRYPSSSSGLRVRFPCPCVLRRPRPFSLRRSAEARKLRSRATSLALLQPLSGVCCRLSQSPAWMPKSPLSSPRADFWCTGGNPSPCALGLELGHFSLSVPARSACLAAGAIADPTQLVTSVFGRVVSPAGGAQAETTAGVWPILGFAPGRRRSADADQYCGLRDPPAILLLRRSLRLMALAPGLSSTRSAGP